MTILVTGSAGFIGYHVSKALLKRGETVVGVDNLNEYYDVNLKKARLNQLVNLIKQNHSVSATPLPAAAILSSSATAPLSSSSQLSSTAPILSSTPTYSAVSSTTPSAMAQSRVPSAATQSTGPSAIATPSSFPETIGQFYFYPYNIADKKSIDELLIDHPSITHIIHLAAQAGVRYSLINPYAYTEANINGHLNILELSRHLKNCQHVVYASSSSVYGSNQKLPFAVSDPVEQPISLYAATKRSCELMSYTYSHLYQIPTTGLRYFTVYGPWGRPDMSAFIFTKAIMNETSVPVFNEGDMRRNFTYIDDIVEGTLACLDKPDSKQLARIYNIGNNRSEHLMDFIQVLEKAIGKKAKLDFQPIQPGDVKETIADISETTRDFGFIPKTNIETGLNNFVNWYRSFYANIRV